MKRIIVLLVVVIGVIAVFFYLKPAGKSPAMSQNPDDNPAESSIAIHMKEPTQPENRFTQAAPSINTSQSDVPLYDTKSDPSVQAIDPEKDPANEVKSK